MPRKYSAFVSTDCEWTLPEDLSLGSLFTDNIITISAKMDLRPCSNRSLIDHLFDPRPHHHQHHYYHLGASLDHQSQRLTTGSSDGDDGTMNLSNTPSSAGSPADQGAPSPSLFPMHYHHQRRQHHPHSQQILHCSRPAANHAPRNGSDAASCLVVSSSTPALDEISRHQQHQQHPHQQPPQNQYSPLLSGVSTTTTGPMAFYDADHSSLVDETFENETVANGTNQDNGTTPIVTRQSSSATIVVSSPGTKLYPSTHPLGLAKHICSICGDRASGKHYGVHRYCMHGLEKVPLERTK